MKKYKLKIDLLPKGAWYNDLSKTLDKKDWDTLRNECYKKANHKCEICGYQTDDLNAHEIWDFDIEHRTQTLKDIIGICSKCHGVIHMRNSERMGFGENAKRHFLKVNNCSELEFASNLAEAQLEFEERNEVLRWKTKVDFSKFGGKNIILKEICIPFIKNPYTTAELEKLKNDSSLNPRILNIEVNNYNGAIKIMCDKTNKIEWFTDGKKIKTVFNFCQKFKTELCVRETTSNSLYFIISGVHGVLKSKVFLLYD